MSVEQYKKALRSGEKSYHSSVSKGRYPYPPSLEDILPEMTRYPTQYLGIVQIPTERMIGTGTSARKAAFAPNFMPLLPSSSEFAAKWIHLCAAHENEGIREPVTAYEFMNYYYVIEGNKRVSVLKFFDDPVITASVTRILPPRDDSYENRLYYEYLDFHRVSAVNYLTVSRLGDYAHLLERLKKEPDEVWSDDDKLHFRSFYLRFCEAYERMGGRKLPITVGDAILAFLNSGQNYDRIKEKLAGDLRVDLSRVWDNILLRCESNTAELLMQPAEEPQVRRTLLGRLLPASAPKLKVAFLYTRTPQTSRRTYSHELGRMHLQQTFGDQITTSVYENLTADTAEEAIEKAIRAGNTTIFTTSAEFIEPSLLAAIRHPSVRVLNCSLNCSHTYIRTYYGRMYEAKFLTGAIAGAISESGHIGYAADYPTYGMIADINAFALGAKMVNPRAVIDLEWFTTENWDRQRLYHDNDVAFLSGPPEDAAPDQVPGLFGLYSLKNGVRTDIALPMWHWGRFYELLIRSTLSGSWKNADPQGAVKALNYWWGLSAGVVDVICSRRLSPDTEKLIELLKQAIIAGTFNPFAGILRSQEKVIQTDPSACLSPVEIITMDWLNENVQGHIPTLEEMIPSARPFVRLQGIGSREQQWTR